MATVLSRPRSASRWSVALATQAIVVVALLVVFRRDVADMAALWWRISTYQHCLFIVPIVGWLLWQRRGEVARVAPAGWVPGLLLMLAAGLVWLVGQAGEVALFRHAALVAMVQASVVAVLGPAVARACAFPLFYLLFLVPFGDEFVAPMQVVTARIATALLHLTGVRASLDGVFITTPAGWFEVAEACAGVKFLIALVAYAALVAHVAFRSFRRRALFMLAAVVVPVVANGLRAWGTIVAAELTSVEAASGFDHIVYGWFFFAFVALVLMVGAWRFFDRRLSDSWLGGRTFAVAKRPVASTSIAPLALAVALLPVAWDAAASTLGRVALPARVDLPQVAGWSRVADSAVPAWTPRFDEADHRLVGRYGTANGQRVDVGLALYGWQGRGREITGYGQGADNPDDAWAWTADLPSIAGGKTVRLLGPDRRERIAVTFWLVGEKLRTSAADVKLASLAARVSGRDQAAGVLVVAAEGPGAGRTLTAFMAALGAPEAALRTAFAQARGR